MGKAYDHSSAKIRRLILDEFKAAGETVGPEEQVMVDIAVHAATSAIETLFRVSSSAEDVRATATLALSALYAHAFELAQQGIASLLAEDGCNQRLH